MASHSPRIIQQTVRWVGTSSYLTSYSGVPSLSSSYRLMARFTSEDVSPCFGRDRTVDLLITNQMGMQDNQRILRASFRLPTPPRTARPVIQLCGRFLMNLPSREYENRRMALQRPSKQLRSLHARFTDHSPWQRWWTVGSPLARRDRSG